MKFGKTEKPGTIDYTLPYDHEDTIKVLQKNEITYDPAVYVGCGKWNRQDLKDFFPDDVKDELAYYSSQFNSIELNATFYSNYNAEQIIEWRDRTPDDFKFFPKIPQYISHMKRLNDVQNSVDRFIGNIRNFSSKLEMVFLQLHNNFGFKNFNRLAEFIGNFPKDIPLAVEVRNAKWYNDHDNLSQFYDLLEKHNVTHIITDTAGRRDLLHMRLTTPVAFVRYVGANHPLDYARLDDWLERLNIWTKEGLQKIYFFVHQNEEAESPALASYFIDKLNERLELKLKSPILLSSAMKV
jgi:uncharacterized protein YecE (DUF72 family)